MAVTAKFAADFSSFIDAIDRAQVSLVDFGAGAGRVESALNKMVDNFSGRKLIQEASLMTIAVEKAGGVSALTASQIEQVGAKANEAAEKLTKLGYEVPQGLQNLANATKTAGENTGFFGNYLKSAAEYATGLLSALSVEHLVEFGFSAIESAGRINTLSQATGVAREDLQRLGYVAQGFGLGMEEIGKAIEQFSSRLASGDASAVSAVQKLGLSVSGLLASGPTEAFLTFAEAAGRIEDPMQKGGVVAEALGGKLAKVLLPALGDLRSAMNDVPKTSIISDENILKADEFDNTLKHATTTLKAWAVAVFGSLVSYNAWLEKQSGVNEATNIFGQALERVTTGKGHDIELTQSVITTTDLLANKLKALREEAMMPLSQTQKDAIVELAQYGVSQKEIAQLLSTSQSAVKQYTDQVKEQAEAMKASVDAAKKYKEILDQMDKETFKLAQEHEKQWRDEQLRTLALVNAAVLAEFDAQTKLNAEWGLNAAGAIKIQSSALDTLNLKLAELHASRVEGISQAKQEQLLMDEYTKALYDEAVALDTVAASTEKQASATVSATEKFNQFKNTLVLGVTDLETVNKELSAFYDQLAAQGNIGMPGPQGVGIPGAQGVPRVIGMASHATGISNAPSGHWAMVGERGPEAMYVPKGSTILPNGAAPGGTTVVNHWYVNGSIRDLAEPLMDEITNRIMQDRLWQSR